MHLTTFIGLHPGHLFDLAQRESDVLQGGHVRVKINALKHHPDVLANEVEIDPLHGDLHTRHVDGTTCRLFESVDAT
ncbi:MAG: hypothetical protein ACD_23C00346G0004 [uncultured bacterium]|nr:MAG: hypothetical protein ACD_23C00346G0004 [uncultured bacterium]